MQLNSRELPSELTRTAYALSYDVTVKGKAYREWTFFEGKKIDLKAIFDLYASYATWGKRPTLYNFGKLIGQTKTIL